ncbi:semaphorin-7A [Scomber scombrus]|uniref:Semaphorin-7A n=1 Tax=Scomber scombrus TaxID=13677 RepID=A0AAV1NS15_SCOSC
MVLKRVNEKGIRPSFISLQPKVFFLQCVEDSTKISLEALNLIKTTSEMEQWVQPGGNSGPLLIHRHSYTHILADSPQQKRNNYHPVLFLSLRSGSSADSTMDRIKVPSKSKYFLQCPVTSHHAQYIWRHDNEKTVSCSMTDQQCLLLIDSMGPEQVGSYKCESEEMGYSKVLAQY